MAAARMMAPFDTIDELLEALGGISGKRVRLRPAPGTATEKDLIRLNDRKERLYELVEGTLVEKGMGLGEGGVEADLIYILRCHLDRNDIGDVLSSSSSMRLFTGVVRLPDISFILWESYPNGERPNEPVPDLFPDLAIEVLSESNTPGEMARKRKEYFLAGTQLVWQVDPRKRTIDVFTAPDQRTTLTETDTLDGGDLLPGFSVRVDEVFARVPKTPRSKKKK